MQCTEKLLLMSAFVVSVTAALLVTFTIGYAAGTRCDCLKPIDRINDAFEAFSKAPTYTMERRVVGVCKDS